MTPAMRKKPRPITGTLNADNRITVILKPLQQRMKKIQTFVKALEDLAKVKIVLTSPCSKKAIP
jgi:hypothetical protein